MSVPLQRDLFSRELQRVDELRDSLSSVLRTMEDDVVEHYVRHSFYIRVRKAPRADTCLLMTQNELQQVARRQHKLQSRVSDSLVLAVESRVLRVVEIVRGWLRHRTLRALLLALVAARVWAALRRRGLPQMFAQLMIRWLAKVSSLDSPAPPRAQLPASSA